MNSALAFFSLLALVVLGCAEPPCAPGTFRLDTLRFRCIPCGTGYFQAQAGQTRCEKCPDGLVATTQGSTECVTCPEHSRPNGDGNRCVCDKGRGRTTRNGRCELCPPGTFSVRPGIIRSCQPCATGTFQPEAGQSQCIDCPRGTLSAIGSTECVTCPPDEFLNNKGKCVTCPPGRTYDRYANLCEKCHMNRYKPTKGLHTCLPCPPGQFSLKGARECIECPEGSILLKSGKCLKCPAGSRLKARKMICERCPINTYMPYENVEPKCFKCTGPTFAMEGAKECTRCPLNMKLMQDGTCAECPVGSVYDEMLFKCEVCGVNRFSRGDAVYKNSCQLCPSGSYSRRGSSICFHCPRGQAYIASTDKCGTCGAGTGYDVFEGECKRCDPSFYSPDVGNESCHYCNSGKSNEARTACVD